MFIKITANNIQFISLAAMNVFHIDPSIPYNVEAAKFWGTK